MALAATVRVRSRGLCTAHVRCELLSACVLQAHRTSADFCMVSSPELPASGPARAVDAVATESLSSTGSPSVAPGVQSSHSDSHRHQTRYMQSWEHSDNNCDDDLSPCRSGGGLCKCLRARLVECAQGKILAPCPAAQLWFAEFLPRWSSLAAGSPQPRPRRGPFLSEIDAWELGHESSAGAE